MVYHGINKSEVQPGGEIVSHTMAVDGGNVIQRHKERHGWELRACTPGTGKTCAQRIGVPRV